MPRTTVRWEKLFRIILEKSNHKKPWYLAYYDDMNPFAILKGDCGKGKSASEAIQDLLTKYPRKVN